MQEKKFPLCIIKIGSCIIILNKKNWLSARDIKYDFFSIGGQQKRKNSLLSVQEEEDGDDDVPPRPPSQQQQEQQPQQQGNDKSGKNKGFSARKMSIADLGLAISKYATQFDEVTNFINIYNGPKR